jgi:hypothetical protein
MADSLLSSNNMQVNGGEFSIVQGHVIHNSGNIRIEDLRGETGNDFKILVAKGSIFYLNRTDRSPETF